VSASSIRLWFCLAVSVLAAALADPLVECASNAGWFGTGPFTDHSTLDVVPAAAAGGLLILLNLGIRIQRIVFGMRTPLRSLLHASRDELGGGIVRLLPAAFAMQIGVLFLMETAEQYAVYGHGLGGTIWLGAPIAVSLAAHAAACVLVAFIGAACVRTLARAAAGLIRIMLSAVRLPVCPLATAVRRLESGARTRTRFVLAGLGERAPPAFLASFLSSLQLGVRECFLHRGFVTFSLP